MTLLYDNFVQKIANNFEAAIAEIEAVHNFEYGQEFEIAICKTLRRALPQKFGICRGYVIASDGRSAGDDVIIYERLRFPTLRTLEEDYSRKEKVPIEAVFAYIEAKHTLQLLGDGPSSFAHAIEQAAKVRQLCETRLSVPLTQITPGMNLAGGKVAALDGFPEIRNPTYTMVLSRYVRIRESEGVAKDSEEIERALMEVRLGGYPSPDLIVAGNSHLAYPARRHNDQAKLLSPFVSGNAGLVGRTVKGLAFGIAVVHLLWALDYIELGKMPWNQILANGLGYDINFYSTVPPE